MGARRAKSRMSVSQCPSKWNNEPTSSPFEMSRAALKSSCVFRESCTCVKSSENSRRFYGQTKSCLDFPSFFRGVDNWQAFARHRLNVEQLAIQLKGAATERLVHKGILPLASFLPQDARRPNCFRGASRRCFLTTWRTFDAQFSTSGRTRYRRGNALSSGGL
jgi:hypothetical protein